jgi:hypothetical protein
MLQQSKNDFYNETRALLRLYEYALDAGEHLSDVDRARLITVYHFLFTERVSPVLFNQCHEALWDSFEQTDDTNNLFNLFRHSSFFWRLRDEEDRDKEYIEKLAPRFQASGLLLREAAYYASRASSRRLSANLQPSG